MIAVHCDNRDCDTWGGEPVGWVYVMYDPTMVRHYCSRWCMVVEESRDVEPTESVDV